jgi:Lipocalin-like domain
MKKVIVLAVLGLILVSCKSKSPVNTNTKVSSQVDIKGEWVISSVTYPGSDYIKINSFDIADSKCFEGSKWKFISNNNEGTMSLTSANCTAFSSPITWYINQDKQLVLKVIQADMKAKKVRSGYVLTVANQTETSFQLVDNISVGTKPTNVIYQFNKTSK